jgi:hypothetical protein
MSPGPIHFLRSAILALGFWLVCLGMVIAIMVEVARHCARMAAHEAKARLVGQRQAKRTGLQFDLLRKLRK